uniref:5'-nucleotidase, cytosolic IAa n=1 Tax=Stegastes partitus TaxID=144197 RepID=A0A3B4ZF40_9TELE
MSLDPVQVMSGQVEELKVAPSSNGDSRGSWEEKEELDQDHLVLTSKPKSPKPENAVTVAVSSRVLFRTEVEQKVFEQKGVEEYLRYQIEHENEPFAPGPAFPFVKALEAVNARLRELYPQSEELFDIVLVTYNHAHVGIRLINTINHHNLFIERFCMTGGSSPIGYLKAWHTNLYLSADADKVREALAEGEHTLFTACGMKLLIILEVLPLTLRKHLPDSSSSNSLWRRCEESLAMFSALLLQLLWKSSWTEVRESPMTLSAPLAILCRPFLSDILQLERHVEMQDVRTLSTTPL